MRLSEEKIHGRFLTALMPLVLAGLFFCGPLQALPAAGSGPREAGASARISRISAFIGDELTLTLSVTHPEGSTAAFPEIKQAVGGFVLSKPAPSSLTEKGNSLITEKRIYSITSLETGKMEIPGFTFLIKDKNGTVTLLTPKMEVSVRSLLEENAGRDSMKKIKPPFYLPLSLKPYARRAAFAATALFILAAACFFLFIRKKTKKLKPEPIEDSWDKALRKIKELKESHDKGTGSIKDLYYSLSLIIRYYIEERFSLAAPERTTEEFLQMISGDGSAIGRYCGSLARFLTECDRVKYARYAPAKQETDRVFVSAEDFVRETMLKEEENARV